jgi:N-acetylglucosamine kinase-like BadF-type ATPase
VAVIAGTSNNCWGWDEHRRIGRVMGNGSEFGENGGSVELVQRAKQAVAKAWTRRGLPTALTQAFIDLAGANSEADLLEGLSQGYYDIGPEAAPLVFQVAQAGDTVAVDAIRWSGTELASLATGVIRQLGFENRTFEVVLVGSMFNGGRLLLDPMSEAILAVAPAARLVRLTVPPVVGAVLLGMQAGGLHAQGLRQSLIASTRALIDPEATDDNARVAWAEW